jgi:UrcA family protein
MTIPFKTLALLALAVSGATVAQATKPTAPIQNGVPTAVVQTGDLNLSKRSDVHRLRQRIADSLEAVCGSYAGSPIDEDLAIAACRRHALADLPPAVLALVSPSSTRRA